MGQVCLQRFAYRDGATSYAAAVHITFEPLWDLDAASAETVANLA